MSNKTASFAKLKSGNWGVRIMGTARKGDKVTVIKKDGSSQEIVIGNVIWSGNGITLAAIPQREPQSARTGGGGGGRGRRRTGCSCGSYEDEVNEGDCFTCRHDQE